MTAEIIQLGDLEDEEGKFHAFLDELKQGWKKSVFIVDDGDGNCAVGHTAKTRAELIVMLYSLQEFTRYLITEMPDESFDGVNDDE